MGYRYYDPTNCRFLTRDPIGSAGGVNLYAYCRNNPINRFDPLGLDDGEDVLPSGALNSHTSFGNGGRNDVNKQINEQIATPLANAAQTVADLHPLSPLAKAMTGKDNRGRRLSTRSRATETGFSILAMVPIGSEVEAVANTGRRLLPKFERLTIHVGKMAEGNFHIMYDAGGKLAHGIESEGQMLIREAQWGWLFSGRRFNSYFKIPLPIRNVNKAMEVGSECRNCVTAAAGAWWRGLFGGK